MCRDVEWFWLGSRLLCFDPNQFIVGLLTELCWAPLIIPPILTSSDVLLNEKNKTWWTEMCCQHVTEMCGTDRLFLYVHQNALVIRALLPHVFCVLTATQMCRINKSNIFCQSKSTPFLFSLFICRQLWKPHMENHNEVCVYHLRNVKKV